MDSISHLIHHIKKCYLKLLSFLLIVRYKIFFPNIELRDSLLIHSFIKTSRGNALLINSSTIEGSKIFDFGKYSKISISSSLRNCVLEIHGSNNSIVIDKDIKIFNAHIIIRGQDCKFVVGKETAINGGEFVVMGKHNEIVIGERCMLAHDVNLWATDSHPILDYQGNVTNPSRPIHLSDHVWLGKNVCVLKGVTIGKNAIVGMNSLVVKDIAPHTINVGNPSKPVKEVADWKRAFIEI